MLPLAEVVDRLAAMYGEPVPPPARTLLDLVLLENVAYLVDDQRRERAFETLRQRVGTFPRDLLAATDATLGAVASEGIQPANQIDKLRHSAQVALDAFDGDVESVRSLPLKQTTRAQLLRQHGQTTCRRTRPLCEGCALSDGCAYSYFNAR
jgi:endonuclease III